MSKAHAVLTALLSTLAFISVIFFTSVPDEETTILLLSVSPTTVTSSVTVYTPPE